MPYDSLSRLGKSDSFIMRMSVEKSHGSRNIFQPKYLSFSNRKKLGSQEPPYQTLELS